MAEFEVPLSLHDRLILEGKGVRFSHEQNEKVADYIHDSRMEYLPETRQKAGQSRIDIENGPVLVEGAS